MARVFGITKKFMDPAIFKAYDIRGKYPSEINEVVVFEISRVLGRFWSDSRKGKIIVACDGRLSSPKLYKAAIAGLEEEIKERARVIRVGLATTPIFYFLVNKLGAVGGIMVTASHNPKEYNGLKVVRFGAEMISGKEILKMMTSSSKSTAGLMYKTGGVEETAKQARASMINHQYLDRYVNFLKKQANPKKFLRIVFDCSNGTAGLVLKKIKIPGFRFYFLNSKIDGRFPAHGPNPLLAGALRQLQSEVVRREADFGVAFDADGDRAFFVDNKGRALPSYVIAQLLLLKIQGPFVLDAIVYKALEKLDFLKQRKVYPSRVGTFYIKEIMKKHKAALGVEFSGHYYFKEFFYADGGIFAAIEVMNVLSALPYSLADFWDLQDKKLLLKNFDVRTQNAEFLMKRIYRQYKKSANKIERMDGVTFDFGNIWLVARPSNTEPLVRFFVGAPDQKQMSKYLAKLRALAS
jgi:phosphomannomutase